MANRAKIVGEKHTLALELAKQNYSLCAAGQQLGVAKDTYRAWLLKNGLPLPPRRSKHQESQDQFVQICEKALQDGTKIKLNETGRTLSLHPDAIQNILKKHPHLRTAIRHKTDAIKEDKVLSLEEVQSRLPDQTHRVLAFVDGKYQIQAADGCIYYKRTSKLHQGDPRNKCGSVVSRDIIKDELKKIGYTLLEDSYIIKRQALRAIHDDCGFVRENRFSNFFAQGCPRCLNVGTSKAEREMSAWVESLGFTVEKFRFKGKTKGREIDIYVPSVGVGIEYCGLYWHSEPRVSAKDLHYEKCKQACEVDIRLLTIFEDEWLERADSVRGFIRSVLGSFDLKVGARKCEVVELSASVGIAFCDKYHIQGAAFRSLVYFGLIYAGDLVGVMSAGPHHRNSGVAAPVLVLNRLCFKSGVQIVGGASKLFKYLLCWAKMHKYANIVSWSDNRWSVGGIYRRLGFELAGELPPDYSYVKGSRRFSKQSLRKTPEERLSGKTEKELRESQGFRRIWDCGKIRWNYALLFLD